MPINYSQYHPHWHFISWIIRFKRAKNRCEKCGVENYSFIRRFKEAWKTVPYWEIADYKLEGWTNKEITKEFNCTYVVLTVAHLNHDIKDNHFSNLAALCQKCHLKHDIKHHVNNRRYGRKWKINQTTLEL